MFLLGATANVFADDTACDHHWKRHLQKKKEAQDLAQFVSLPAAAVLLLCPPCLVHALASSIVIYGISEELMQESDNAKIEFQKCLKDLSVKDQTKAQDRAEEEKQKQEEIKDEMKGIDLLLARHSLLKFDSKPASIAPKPKKIHTPDYNLPSAQHGSGTVRHREGNYHSDNGGMDADVAGWGEAVNNFKRK